MSDGGFEPEPASKVSRGKFLAAAGISVGGFALGSPLAAAATAATAASPLVAGKLPRKWDRETDVVVVGSGGAALAGAIAAKASGSQVLVLERAPLIGGTTLKSGGEYWIPNNPVMQAKGLTGPREDAIKLMLRLSYPSIYDPGSPLYGVPQRQFDLIATFYDRGAEMVSYMDKVGAFKSMVQPSLGYTARPDLGFDPDYHADLPENKAPYGRGLDAVGTGSGGGGNLILNMQNWVKKNGVPVVYKQRVVGVFRNSHGQVVGVQVESGGKMLAIRARKGVIFGTGGFTQDSQKALNFLRGPIFGGCGVPTNTGDFVDIGIALGAELGNMNHAFWVQNLVEQALQYSSVPAEVWIPYGDSMVLVNKYGQRITNEKMVYNERTQSHFTWAATES
ncbi:MAG: 3-oxosteroid 1-dehydrogenase, partial [Actinomycetota bacterium]|nr:3-oxosteroid 1-dehydrogenase [Actinomycetota bacterium]